MKTYKITVIFISVLFWISCDTDQLEQNNPTQLSPETFFKNEAQVRASVNAVYASLQTIGSYSRNYYYMMDNMGHDNTANIQQEANKIIFLDFSFDASSELVRAFWDSEFRGVNKANFVIDNADRINEIPNSLLSQEMKDKYIGEAKFLRALYYFNLVTRF